MSPVSLHAMRKYLRRRHFAACSVLCLFLVTLFFPVAARRIDGINTPTTGGADYNNPDPENPGFEETSVFVNVQRVGGMELPAIIKDRVAFLPVTNVFDFLKIKNAPAPGFDSVTGFFIDPGATFCIDNIRHRITYQGRVTELGPEDLIQTETGLFLRQEFFSLVFGLNCSFNFSNLSVNVSTSYDLPAIREMQIEDMHRNVSRLKGEIKADTSIGRSYPVFSMGAADWLLTSTQQSNGYDDFRAGITLGAVLAGGEANVSLNYYSRQPFDKRQQFYQWRFVNNDHKALRQISLGRIITQSTATIYDPVNGIQLTNTPTTYRRSFGTYRLSKMTQPGWTVELYVNNVLVDFTRADASGFFSFDVPLVYGNTIVRLRYYGLYGEESTSEENITIPFNFLPVKELQYSVSAGIVEDTLHSRYARGTLNYGLSRRLTIGLGSEYLSSAASGKHMPFINASLALTSHMMLSGEYTYGVSSKATLTYRMPLNAQLELNYVKQAKDQKVLLYQYLEERRAALSIPFRTRSFGGVTRLMFNQVILTEHSHYTTAEWLVSASLRNVSANITTYLVGTGHNDPPKFDPYLYTTASLAIRLRKGYVLTPQAQYSYTDRGFMSTKCELEKQLFNKGFMNIYYEQNFKSNVHSLGVGVRYDLSFARVGVAARQYGDISAITETASGSFIYDSKTAFSRFGCRNATSRAGITILPYLDLNANGRRDEGEPKVAGLKVRMNSGRIEYSIKDTVTRLYDLEPYTSYLVDVSENSFEHIGWQIRHKTMNVAVGANQFKLIEIPVVVMGEASGMVYLKGASGQKGQGRINVCFYRADSTLIGCTTTEPDGYFSYMGLAAGSYTVRVDRKQLATLRMTAYPECSAITVLPTKEGVLLEGIDFTIQPAAPAMPPAAPISKTENLFLSGTQ